MRLPRPPSWLPIPMCSFTTCDARNGELSQLAAVAGVTQGEVLAKHAVTHQFLHDTISSFTTHARTGFCKSVRVDGKGDAHLAIELMLSFFSSLQRAVTWIHADNANELKGTKVLTICRGKSIRITTTTVNSSRKNRQEPQWRAQMAVVRKFLEVPSSGW